MASTRVSWICQMEVGTSRGKAVALADSVPIRKLFHLSPNPNGSCDCWKEPEMSSHKHLRYCNKQSMETYYVAHCIITARNPHILLIGYLLDMEVALPAAKMDLSPQSIRWCVWNHCWWRRHMFTRGSRQHMLWPNGYIAIIIKSLTTSGFCYLSPLSRF